MKNFWKKFAVIGAVLCLVVTFCAVFTACGETKTAGVFTVTFVDESGKGVAGVEYQMCVDGDNGNCYLSKPSDETGKAVCDVRKYVLDDDNNRVPDPEFKEAQSYHVMVKVIPAGYALVESSYFGDDSTLHSTSFKNNQFTITLKIAAE